MRINESFCDVQNLEIKLLCREEYLKKLAVKLSKILAFYIKKYKIQLVNVTNIYYKFSKIDLKFKYITKTSHLFQKKHKIVLYYKKREI